MSSSTPINGSFRHTDYGTFTSPKLERGTAHQVKDLMRSHPEVLKQAEEAATPIATKGVTQITEGLAGLARGIASGAAKAVKVSGEVLKIIGEAKAESSTGYGTSLHTCSV